MFKKVETICGARVVTFILRNRFALFISLIFVLPSEASVKSFDDKLSIATVNEVHNFQLRFRPTNNLNNSEVDYEPNTTALSGFQLSYKGYALAYLTSAPFLEEDIALKGETSYEDIRGGVFLGKKKQFVLLGYYNRFKGFFIENTAAIDPTATPFIQNGSMETFNSGAGLMYIFDPDEFSASAAFIQSDQQTKSGGSFLMVASFDTNVIKGVDSFAGVPTSVSDDFGDDQEFKEGKFGTTSLTFGYGHTFVWKNFFLSLTLLLGYGYQVREFTVGTEEISGTTGTTKQSYGASLGYNGESFFLTLAVVQDVISFETRSIEITPGQFSQRLLLGVRF